MELYAVKVVRGWYWDFEADEWVSEKERDYRDLIVVDRELAQRVADEMRATVVETEI